MGRERSTAIRIAAHEWLLSVVNALVCFQISFLGEAFAAALKVAYKWFLSKLTEVKLVLGKYSQKGGSGEWGKISNLHEFVCGF